LRGNRLRKLIDTPDAAAEGQQAFVAAFDIATAAVAHANVSRNIISAKKRWTGTCIELM
jgi:hypothetical protein